MLLEVGNYFFVNYNYLMLLTAGRNYKHRACFIIIKQGGGGVLRIHTQPSAPAVVSKIGHCTNYLCGLPLHCTSPLSSPGMWHAFNHMNGLGKNFLYVYSKFLICRRLYIFTFKL